jgi:hypothetical protein
VAGDRQKKCVLLFSYLVQKYEKFFKGTHDKCALVYDRASILYSLNKFDFGSDGVSAML